MLGHNLLALHLFEIVTHSLLVQKNLGNGLLIFPQSLHHNVFQQFLRVIREHHLQCLESVLVEHVLVVRQKLFVQFDHKRLLIEEFQFLQSHIFPSRILPSSH